MVGHTWMSLWVSGAVGIGRFSELMLPGQGLARPPLWSIGSKTALGGTCGADGGGRVGLALCTPSGHCPEGHCGKTTTSCRPSAREAELWS